MLVLALALGGLLLICTLRFGRGGIERLATMPLRGGVFAVLGCLAQLAGTAMLDYRLPFLLASIALLFVFCWYNRRRAGIIIATTGIVLNMTVMVANDGDMPINPAALARMSGVYVPSDTVITGSKDRVLDDEAARLPWLGDRLVLPGPLGQLAVWSLGDVFLIVGVGRLMWQTMKGRHDDSVTSWASATPSRA